MKNIVTVALFSLSSLFSQDLKTALDPLKPGQILKAEFIQKKVIKDIPKPLVSKGVVVIHSDKGLLWQTNTPFKQATFLNAEGIYSLQQSKKTPLTKANATQAKKVSEILSKILSGDFDALDFFDIEDMESSDKKWKKRLIPKVEGIKNFLTSIDVVGSNHIHYVTLHRKNNDVETIEFSNHIIFKSDQMNQNLDQEQKAIFQ